MTNHKCEDQSFPIDKNLGTRLGLAAEDLPRTNADDQPVIRPTQQ